MALISNVTFSSNEVYISDQNYYNASQSSNSTITANINMAKVLIQDSEFHNNTADINAVMINLLNDTLVNIARCKFSQNIGGIVIASVADVYFTDSSFHNNTATDRSRLISIYLATAILENTDFAVNTEVFVALLSGVVLINSFIENNILKHIFTQLMVFMKDYLKYTALH